MKLWTYVTHDKMDNLQLLFGFYGCSYGFSKLWWGEAVSTLLCGAHAGWRSMFSYPGPAVLPPAKGKDRIIT
jgi:hypothetical protein